MEIPELGEHCAHAGEARSSRRDARVGAPVDARGPFSSQISSAHPSRRLTRVVRSPLPRPRLSERRMRPAGFLTVRVQRLRPDLLPRAPREPRVRRLRRDRLGDVRRVPALRREREARPGRRHPRHLRQARGVSPMRPLEAPGDDAAVPRPGMQRKTRRRERVQVQGVPRGGVPEAQIRGVAPLRHSPPAGDGARDAAEPSNRREPIDRTEPTRRRSRGGDRRRLDRGESTARGPESVGAHPLPEYAAPARSDAHAPRVVRSTGAREICAQLGFPHLAALIAHAEAEHAGEGGSGRGRRGATRGARRCPRCGRVLGRRRAGRRTPDRRRGGGGGGRARFARPPRSSASCASVCAEANERVNTLGVCDNAREAFRRRCESTDDTTPSGIFESITATFATSTSTRVRTARTLDTSRSRTPLPNPVLLPKMRMFRQIKQSGFSVLEGIWDLRKNSRIVLRTPL